MLPFLHLNLYFFHRDQPTFGLMMWLAAVTAAYVLHLSFRRARIDADAIGIVAVAVVAGIVGAKLWHVLDTPDEFHLLGWSVLWDTDGFAWFVGTLFPRLASKDRRAADSGPGRSGRGHRLRHWAHWLLSLRRRMLRHSNCAGAFSRAYLSPLGHGLPQRRLADDGCRLPHAAL